MGNFLTRPKIASFSVKMMLHQNFQHQTLTYMDTTMLALVINHKKKGRNMKEHPLKTWDFCGPSEIDIKLDYRYFGSCNNDTRLLRCQLSNTRSIALCTAYIDGLRSISFWSLGERYKLFWNRNKSFPWKNSKIKKGLLFLHSNCTNTSQSTLHKFRSLHSTLEWLCITATNGTVCNLYCKVTDMVQIIIRIID
jgi:hypothetical protein